MKIIIQSLDEIIKHIPSSSCCFADWSKKDVTRFLNLPSAKGWAAMDEERLKVIGLILVLSVCDEIEVLTLSTAPSYRRLGVASMLLSSIICYAHDNKMKCILLEVSKENLPAQSLYEKYSFKKYGVRPNYYQASKGRVISAYLYRKDLNDEEKKNKIKLD